MRTLKISCILLLLFTAISYAQHFQPVPENGLPWAIVVADVIEPNVELTFGDELAVFDEDLCVGSSTFLEPFFDEDTLMIVVWKEWSQGDLFLPGYVTGDSILFRMWDSELNLEFEVSPMFIFGDGTFESHNHASVILDLAVQNTITGTINECHPGGPPIENVEVYLDNLDEPAAISGIEGQYSFNCILSGLDHSLRFVHPDYNIQEINHLVIPLNPIEHEENISLIKTEAEFSDETINLVVDFMEAGIDTSGTVDSTGSVNLDIINSGCTSIEWSLTVFDSIPDWLTIDPFHNLLPADSTQTITVFADFSEVDFALEDGTEYNFQFQFQAEGWENPPLVELTVHLNEITLINSIHEDLLSIPNACSLDQNYPNPFNPATEISFTIAKSEHVLLTVTNLLGQEVARLVDGPLEAGRHVVEFEALNLPSGIFIYKIQTAGYRNSKKMILVK